MVKWMWCPFSANNKMSISSLLYIISSLLEYNPQYQHKNFLCAFKIFLKKVLTLHKLYDIIKTFTVECLECLFGEETKKYIDKTKNKENQEKEIKKQKSYK